MELDTGLDYLYFVNLIKAPKAVSYASGKSDTN